jgi:hypothetical protein
MPLGQTGGSTVGRANVLLLVFLLSSAILLAQQQMMEQNWEAPSSTHVRMAEANCPIGVTASIVGLPLVSNAGPSIYRNPPGQFSKIERRLFILDVANPSSRDIVGARFTAHGFSRRLRFIDPSDPSNKPNLWKTVDVGLNVQGKGHSSSEFSLTDFTAILTSVDLDSITYKDGTQWQAPFPGACSILPKGPVRIAVPQ